MLLATATDPVQSDRRNLEDEEYDEGAEIVGGKDAVTRFIGKKGGLRFDYPIIFFS